GRSPASRGDRPGWRCRATAGCSWGAAVPEGGETVGDPRCRIPRDVEGQLLQECFLAAVGKPRAQKLGPVDAAAKHVLDVAEQGGAGPEAAEVHPPAGSALVGAAPELNAADVGGVELEGGLQIGGGKAPRRFRASGHANPPSVQTGRG